MTCFHSDAAMQMLARLPTAKPADVPEGVPEVTPLTRSFRALRAELQRDGWFQRNLWVEAAQVRRRRSR
jgi:streptomycin 6-kinase